MAKPPSEDRTGDFLPLWDQALSRWVSNSAWYGLHGHIYLGQLAALFSLSQVRKLMGSSSPIGQPPGSAEHESGLASALYSVAKYIPFRHLRSQVFQDGMVHLARAIETQGGLTANLAHIRGSFQLQRGEPAKAVDDFEEALRLTRLEHAHEGVSLSELGFAYLHQMRLFKGLDYLQAGAQQLAILKDVNPGPYVRAMRKLAVGYALNGRLLKAYDARREAHMLAERRGLFDQIR